MGVRFVLRDSGEREEVMPVAVLSASCRSTTDALNAVCSRIPVAHVSRDRARRHEIAYATRSFSPLPPKIFQRKLEPLANSTFGSSQQPFRFRNIWTPLLGIVLRQRFELDLARRSGRRITCRAHSES